MAKFSIKFIDGLAPKEKSYREQDDSLPSFYIEVYPSGAKSWKVIKRPKGEKPITVTLGSYPDMSLFVAKKLAQEKLAIIAQGQNPNLIKAQGRAVSTTLGDAYFTYVKDHILEESTIGDYKKAVFSYLSAWVDSSLASITPQMILDKHAEIAKASNARANGSMRVFRAIYNYAFKTLLDEKRQPLLPPNPVAALSTTRRWSKNKRKKTLVRASDLPSFIEKLEELKDGMDTNNSFAYYAYIRTMLFTGLRGDELRKLTTSRKSALEFESAKGYYDNHAKLLYFFDQKNHEEIEIPLSTQAIDAIELVYKAGHYWLFSNADDGERLSFDKVDSAWRWMQRNGHHYTGHDLRRTFVTVAEALDISDYTLKRLIGHKVDNAQDVTAGYVISSNDRLRKAAQLISNAIMNTGTAPTTTEI